MWATMGKQGTWVYSTGLSCGEVLTAQEECSTVPSGPIVLKDEILQMNLHEQMLAPYLWLPYSACWDCVAQTCSSSQLCSLNIAMS